jgi:hypothetical protein
MRQADAVRMKARILIRVAVFIALSVFLFNSECLAYTVKGTIEKVDIKNYEMTVDGKKVNILKATVFTVNDLGVSKDIIVRDLKDHKGESAVCYGSFNKDGVLEAYRIKVKEGHK